MTHEAYDEKLHELEAPTPVFASFASSISLIALAMIFVQVVL